MRLRLIRNATLLVWIGGRCVVVDPMLDAAGARPPVPETPNSRRNPLCDLPEPAAVVVRGVDAVIVTHLHQDHLDASAIALLPKDRPVFCQPEDAETLRGHGFADVRPVERVLEWDGVRIARTGGRHGTGRIGELMAPVSGFVLAADGEPALYIAGDTIWCDEVRDALDEHRPGAVVVNAGGARFLEGEPIVMTADDVVAVARHAPRARGRGAHGGDQPLPAHARRPPSARPRRAPARPRHGAGERRRGAAAVAVTPRRRRGAAPSGPPRACRRARVP